MVGTTLPPLSELNLTGMGKNVLTNVCNFDSFVIRPLFKLLKYFGKVFPILYLHINVKTFFK